MPKNKDCIFCNIKKEQLIYENKTWKAIYDGYPVSRGHILVIPKRHINSIIELKELEKDQLHETIKIIYSILKEIYHPDGINIGINEGAAAGQTIPHLHIHIIPRYNGDMENPKGGVRGVIPNKQKY